MDENREATDATLHYPCEMRRGRCVTHEVTATGAIIERYGTRCQTHAEAFGGAEVIDRGQVDALQPADSDDKKGGGQS